MQDMLCVIGNARSQQDNPITFRYSQFFITFVVESESGCISDIEVSTALKLTNDFIKSIFIGTSLSEMDDAIIEKVRTRYLGSSQKAIIVAYKDAVKKYKAWKTGIIITE